MTKFIIKPNWCKEDCKIIYSSKKIECGKCRQIWIDDLMDRLGNHLKEIQNKRGEK